MPMQIRVPATHGAVRSWSRTAASHIRGSAVDPRPTWLVQADTALTPSLRAAGAIGSPLLSRVAAKALRRRPTQLRASGTRVRDVVPHGGPTVVISGASQGTGRALALKFAQDGYNVVLAARGAEALREAEDCCQAVLKPGRLVLPVPISGLHPASFGHCRCTFHGCARCGMQCWSVHDRRFSEYITGRLPVSAQCELSGSCDDRACISTRATSTERAVWSSSHYLFREQFRCPGSFAGYDCLLCSQVCAARLCRLPEARACSQRCACGHGAPRSHSQRLPHSCTVAGYGCRQPKVCHGHSA